MARIIGMMASTPELGIASNGKLPWNRPPDGKWFAGTTKDRIVIMGRKTADEIYDMTGANLTGRLSMVISRQPLSVLLNDRPPFKPVTDPGEIDTSIFSTCQPDYHLVKDLLTYLTEDNALLRNMFYKLYPDAPVYDFTQDVFVIGGLTTLQHLHKVRPIKEFYHTVSTKPTDHPPTQFLSLPGFDFTSTQDEIIHRGKDYAVYHRHYTKP